MLTVLFYISAAFVIFDFFHLAVSSDYQTEFDKACDSNGGVMVSSIMLRIAKCVLCFIAAGIGGNFAFVFGIIMAVLCGLGMLGSLLTGKIFSFMIDCAMMVLYIVAL